MLQLDVVNSMLATMGEAPLNSLTDPHTFRGAAQRTLTNYNRQIQSRGWWFNQEVLNLQPSGVDGKLYLPGDTINVRVPGFPEIVQRGTVMYDTTLGTDVFTEEREVYLIRLLDFEKVPEIVAQFIAASAILNFQTNYDGDSTRTRELKLYEESTKIEANAEETRQLQVNLRTSNPTIAYIKSITRQARANIRP